MNTINKSLTVTVVLLLSLSTIVSAQQQRRQQMKAMQKVSLEERADVRIAVMKEYMDLSDAEETKYRSAFIDFEKKAVQRMKGTRNQPRKRRMEARDLKKEHMKEMQKILSKDHFTAFLENHEAIQYDIRQRLRTMVQSDDQ